MIKDFPKKCIVCKRTDASLVGYDVSVSKTTSRSTRSKTIISKSYQVPVCEDCKALLKKRENIGLLSYCLILISIICFAFSVAAFFGGENYATSLIVGGVVLLIISLILFILKSINPHKIKKYVNPTLGGTIYEAIKDPEYKQEMLDLKMKKVVKEAIEKELRVVIINCPRCGSKQNKDDGFCLDCGKDLRQLN